MKLVLEDHAIQTRLWPPLGRCILAHYDSESIVVYQAYNQSIGNHASSANQLGGEFRFDRMSWIKPSFLWMMYRSDWGTKTNQTVVLAIHIRLAFFEEILAEAIHSSFEQTIYPSHGDWKERLERSEVRLQWDPDHAPSGARLKRRAIQLGLRGKTLRTYATEAVQRIDDVSQLVSDGRRSLKKNQPLMIPRERPFTPSSASVRKPLGL